jgi:hypothetical protein
MYEQDFEDQFDSESGDYMINLDRDGGLFQYGKLVARVSCSDYADNRRAVYKIIRDDANKGNFWPSVWVYYGGGTEPFIDKDFSYKARKGAKK